jgi:hypothetical protein
VTVSSKDVAGTVSETRTFSWLHAVLSRPSTSPAAVIVRVAGADTAAPLGLVPMPNPADAVGPGLRGGGGVAVGSGTGLGLGLGAGLDPGTGGPVPTLAVTAIATVAHSAAAATPTGIPLSRIGTVKARVRRARAHANRSYTDALSRVLSGV